MTFNKICIGSANFGMEYGLDKKSPLLKKILKKYLNF